MLFRFIFIPIIRRIKEIIMECIRICRLRRIFCTIQKASKLKSRIRKWKFRGNIWVAIAGILCSVKAPPLRDHLTCSIISLLLRYFIDQTLLTEVIVLFSFIWIQNLSWKSVTILIIESIFPRAIANRIFFWNKIGVYNVKYFFFSRRKI